MWAYTHKFISFQLYRRPAGAKGRDAEQLLRGRHIPVGVHTVPRNPLMSWPRRHTLSVVLKIIKTIFIVIVVIIIIFNIVDVVIGIKGLSMIGAVYVIQIKIAYTGSISHLNVRI